MREKRIHRRAMLRGLGGVAVALPALEIMRPSSLLSPYARSKAQAQVGAAPKRYLVSYIGASTGRWLGRSVGDGRQHGDFLTPDREGSGYDVKRALQPLLDEGVRDDFSVVSGLTIPWGADAPSGGRRIHEFHSATVTQQIAGTRARSVHSNPEGPTSDQLAKDAIAGDTILPHMSLRVQADNYTGSSGGARAARLSWRQEEGGAMTAVDPFVNPGLAFREIFGGGTPDSSGEGDRQQLRRRSVIDVVRGQTERLMSRLGRADSIRMDQHLSEIRSLETRLERLAGVTGSSCTVPPDPGQDWPVAGIGSDRSVETASNKWSNEDLRADAMIDLIHLAWVCDINRVATLQFNYWKSHLNMLPILGVSQDFHDLTHNSGGTIELLSDGIAWHVAYLAKLVRRLGESVDVDGTSLLDNSVITTLFEGGHGPNPQEPNGIPVPHSTENMSVLIAGRAGGLRSGQHVRGEGRHPAQVMVSAMNAVGVDTDRLGEVVGNIPELG